MAVNSNTPMAIKRRTVSRMAAANPKLRSMEQRAHTAAVNSYSSEILKHLAELECATKSSPHMIQTQPQITVEMRPILFDFLMDVHNRLKLSNQSYFLMINIIDRYCSLRIVRKDHFQLLGLTALWLASKYSDSKQKIPTLDFLRATCCNCYSKKLFVEMESHILKSLDWDVGSPNHDSFIDILLKENFLNIKPERVNDVKYGANYLCQLSQFYTRITFNYSISMISIASVLIMTNSLTLLDDNQFVHFNIQTNNNDKLNKLCSLMLDALKESPLPASFETKYFKNNNEQSPNLNSILKYSYELSCQLYSIPSTPLYRTPIASRTSSTSSQCSTGSSLFTSSRCSSLSTPPDSCTASPIEFNVGHYTSIELQAFINNNKARPLQENLKFECLKTSPSNYTTSQSQDIERKRSNSWDRIEEDATSHIKKYLSGESLHEDI